MTRDEAYPLLYNLIFKGFLAGSLEMGKSFFVFKTITDKEFESVKICAGNPSNRGYLERFNMYFLAHSTLSIEGENILAKRAKNLSDLVSFFSNIPNHLFKYTMVELEKMRLDCYSVLKYMEGFCYTSESRKKWKALRGLSPCSEEVTGIQGTSYIGLNIFQEDWMYLNRVLDEEEDYNREFSSALFIASASNPKGAKQTRNQHDSHIKNIEDRRKKLAETGYIDVKNWSDSGWAAPVDTAEELVAELDRQMKGMKDRHDRFIEEHLKRIKEGAERKTREAEERIRASKRDYDMPPLTVTQRPLTAEETARLVYKKAPTSVAVPSEEYADQETQGKFLRKIGSKVLTARR